MGVICLFLISLAAVLGAGEDILEPAENRIVKGRVIPLEEAPFMLQLRNKTGTICGGILVTPEHVVTAGHCFMLDSYQNITVVGGANLRTDSGINRTIAEFNLHPDFQILRGKNPNSFKGIHADVAVLKLNESFALGPTIQVKAKICSNPLKVNDSLRVYGWGVKARIPTNFTPEHLTNYSNELRTFKTTVTNKRNCRAKFTAGRITNTSVCAYKDRRDACISDSGGPGIRKGELCGLVSWGYLCAHPDQPSIYTDVYALRDFINDKIKS